MSIERKRIIKKFAFIGAASVGKTTIIDIYKKRFSRNPQIIVLEEGAQIFFQDNPDIINEGIHVVSVQEQLQDFVLERERAAYQPKTKLIISDRSVIDPVVYTRIYQTAEEADRLFNHVAHWLPTYTKFFLLDPTGVPQDPGQFRKETSKARLAVHDAFREFFVDNNLPFEMVSGSLQERLKKIDTTIHECLRDRTIFESNY